MFHLDTKSCAGHYRMRKSRMTPAGTSLGYGVVLAFARPQHGRILMRHGAGLDRLRSALNVIRDTEKRDVQIASHRL